MKKLLLLSAIVCGSVSFASAQATDPVAGANKTAPKPVVSKKQQLKDQAEIAKVKANPNTNVANADLKPMLSNAAGKTAAKRPAKKPRVVAAAKTN